MIKIREGYHNSHFTYEYSPFYCANCGKVFGWSRQVTQSPNSETLCHDCFENLPEASISLSSTNQEFFTDEEWVFHMIHNDGARSQGACKICNTYGWNYTR